MSPSSRQDQLPPALDELGDEAGDGEDPEPEPDPEPDPDPEPELPAVNELTALVTLLPAGATSHHFAPKLSLPWPLAVPGPESPV